MITNPFSNARDFLYCFCAKKVEGFQKISRKFEFRALKIDEF